MQRNGIMGHFERLGYDVKNMQLYFEYVEYSVTFSANGYSETSTRALFHPLKESQQLFFALVHFPAEEMKLLQFKGEIEGKECEPSFSSMKNTINHQYALSISFKCKEKIKKDEDLTLKYQYQLMDLALNNKEKILGALRQIYGDNYITIAVTISNIVPIMEYKITAKYPGFKIRKSLKVIADRVDVFGKPLSVKESEEISHGYDDVTIYFSDMLPNTSYVLLNYLE